MNSTALWYATRASGIMALVLFTLTMVLGITTTTRAVADLLVSPLRSPLRQLAAPPLHGARPGRAL